MTAAGPAWIEIAPLPSGVRLGLPVDPRHRETPEDALARGAAGRAGAWGRPELGLAGVVSAAGSVAWEVVPDGSVELEFGRPGKGGGYFVVVYAPGAPSRPVPVATADPFDEDLLAWFEDLARALAEVAGARLRIVDVGADA